MIGEPIISVIMITIGLSTGLQALMKWIFGVNLQPFPPIFHTKMVNVFGLQSRRLHPQLVVSVAMMAGMAWFFKVSRYGIAMRATAFNQQVAQSLGISVKSVFAMARRSRPPCPVSPASSSPWSNGVVGGPCRLRHQGVPGDHLGGLDSVGRRGARLGIIIGCSRTSRTSSTANTCNGANLFEIAPLLPLVFILMIKPYGLFAPRTSSESDHGRPDPPSRRRFPHSYAADTTLFPTKTSRATC